MHTLNHIKTLSVSQIFITSLIALLLGHLMVNTLIPNVAINFAGLIIVSLFIYASTLKRNDFFAFIMVLYFCSTFPYILAKGGGFNMVSFTCLSFYILANSRMPFEKRNRDKWLNLFIFTLLFSSILGWIFNFAGRGLDYVYSIMTFLGIILLLLTASHLEITAERIKIFLKLNFIIILYSTIASINKYLNIIPFDTPMMPVYGEKFDYFEGGGLIGSSPLYGEHSLILLILFSTFLIVAGRYNVIPRTNLIFAAIIAYVNVFMSISRSVFLLSILGLTIIYLFQFKLNPQKFSKIIQPIFIIVFFSLAVFYIVRATKLDFVFERVQEIEEINRREGGITIDRILDGSAFNRDVAFSYSKEKYFSKNNWIIGYGWGTEENNRSAFYVDTSVERGSAHSQIYAILFLFGWMGFIAYWGLIFRVIIKSFKFSGYKNENYLVRTLSFFFFVSFIMFTLNEIKADSVSVPTYFGVTMIWTGMAFSTFNYDNKHLIYNRN